MCSEQQSATTVKQGEKTKVKLRGLGHFDQCLNSDFRDLSRGRGLGRGVVGSELVPPRPPLVPSPPAGKGKVGHETACDVLSSSRCAALRPIAPRDADGDADDGTGGGVRDIAGVDPGRLWPSVAAGPRLELEEGSAGRAGVTLAD